MQEVSDLACLLPLVSELRVASSENYSFSHGSQEVVFAEERGGVADFGSCCRGSVGGGMMLTAVLVLF